MKTTLKKMMLAAVLCLVLPLMAHAQDFGYPKDKAFYKAHWNEVLEDLGPDQFFFRVQYVLFDFDNDKSAELYLWFSMKEAYLYSIKDNKVVRVSETARTMKDEYWLDSFYPHFMAPIELLLDQPIEQFESMEQQVYDMYEIPGIWFGLNPKVEGTFNVKSAANAILEFDCRDLSEALYAIANDEYSEEDMEEYVLDIKNGYASVAYKGDYINKVELCYWNMENGEKLMALHYQLTEEWGEGNLDWFEQTLFMKYNPKTHRLQPIVAPIQGFDFKAEYNFSLPRKGKNITLIGAEDHELQWTGSGFKY